MSSDDYEDVEETRSLQSFELVGSVRPDDASSDADNQWFLLDTEDMDAPEEAQDTAIKEDAVVPADVAEDVDGMLTTDVTVAIDSASACLYASSALELDTACVWESGLNAHSVDEMRGDVTAQWQEALGEFPRVASAGAFRLGHVVISGLEGQPSLPVNARFAIRNNGSSAWPEGTALRIVAGDPYGFDFMPVGALAPGDAAELVLDLLVPSRGDFGVRSAWVLTDAYGEPFGPLFVLEVQWA